LGLRPAQLLQRGRGDVGLSGHARGRREHAMAADEIAALADRLARQTHCLVVMAPDKLRVGRNPVKDRGERIART
jgi:hypothetical protein